MVLLYTMSTILPTVVYDASANILNAALKAFTPQEQNLLESYVSHGPAAEGCCSLLISYASNIRATLGTGETNSGVDFGIYIWVTDITVSLRECPPGMDNSGNSPSPEENDDYAKKTYTHAWKIVQNIISARAQGKLVPGGTCTFSTPPFAQLIEDQGNCAGWDIDMTVELSEE